VAVYLAILAAAVPGLPGKVDRYWNRQLVTSHQVVRCSPRACRVRVRIPGIEQVLICWWSDRLRPHVRCSPVKTVWLAHPA
jgi:hypothetical protein